jgi:hypothetical protein
MTEQDSSGPTAAADGDRNDERGTMASPVERAFMDRARRAVERDQEKPPRRVGQHLLALVAAFGLTFGIVYVFDAFLTAMQKVMGIMDEQEERQKQDEAERKKQEPIPAYVVPPAD